MATEFAEYVYRGLAGGQTIQEAYNEAAAASRAKIGDNFIFSLRRDAKTQAPMFATEAHALAREQAWPWRLRATTSGAQWSLAKAVADPLFDVPAPPYTVPPPGSPFRVLTRFTAADSAIYFGRGRSIRELYQKLTSSAPGVILFHGASGSGKSSLIEAGLEPRVTTSHVFICLRRTKTSGLAGDLHDKLAALAGGDMPIAKAWRKIENDSQRPIIAILDQAEETFTRPQPDPDGEWRALLSELGPLFGPSAQAPRGKLVLSFRKEWLPEIERRIRTLTCAYATNFLGLLDREGVVESMEGLTRNEALRERYPLEIESGLAATIADDLLKDRDSPIAPTLEVLLEDLWNEAGQALRPPETVRRFDRVLYERLSRRGLTLRNFLQRQLLLVGVEPNLKAEALDSGLALDVLHFHTTALGTAERRSREEFVNHYKDLSVDGLLARLLRQLQEINLLFDAGTAVEGPNCVTRLAHDSLSPLVREAFDNSDLPGQRARRILETRTRELEDGITPENAPLDEYDLRVVEAGVSGMRALKPVERELVKVSQAVRAKRDAATAARARNKKRLLQAAGAVGVLIVILFIVAVIGWTRADSTNQDLVKKTTEATRLGSEAVHQRSLDQYATALRALAEGKSGEGIALLSRALETWPENYLAADRLFGVLTQTWLALPIAGPVKAVGNSWEEFAVMPDGSARIFQRGGKGISPSTVYEVSSQSDRFVDLTASLSLSHMAQWSEDGRLVADVIAKEGHAGMTVLDLASPRPPKALLENTGGDVLGFVFFPKAQGLLIAVRPSATSTSTSSLLLWNYGKAKTATITLPFKIGASAKGPRPTSELPGTHALDESSRLLLGTDDSQVVSADVNWETLTLDIGKSASTTTTSAFTATTTGEVFALFHHAGDSFVPHAFRLSGRGIQPLQWRDEVSAPLFWGQDSPDRNALPTSPLRFWPGTDQLILWSSQRCYLTSVRNGDSEEQTPNLFRPGPRWPEADFALLSANGYLATFKEELKQAMASGRSSWLCTIYDARTAVLWPAVEMQESGATAITEKQYDREALEIVFQGDRAETGEELIVTSRRIAEGEWIYQPRPMIIRKDGTRVELEGQFSGMDDANDFVASFSPNGKYVALAAAKTHVGAELMVWEVSTGKRLTNAMQLAVPLFNDRAATFGAPGAVAFIEHEDVVCVGGRNGGVLLWDWRRAQPFSDMLGPYDGPGVQFTNLSITSEPGWIELRGQAAKSDSHGGMVQLAVTRRYEIGWGFGKKGDAVSKSLRRLAETIGGLQCDANGVLLPPAKNAPSPAEQIRRLREEFARADPADPSVKLGQWMLEDRTTRTVSPNAKATISQTFDLLMNLCAWEEAELLSFGNLEKLARIKKARKDFHIDVDQDP